MGWVRAGVSIAGWALVLHSGASSQTPAISTIAGGCQTALNDSRSVLLGPRQVASSFPFAGFSKEPGGILGYDCTVVTFYRLFDPAPLQTRDQRRNQLPPQPQDTSPRFVARIFSAGHNGQFSAGHDGWVVEKTCPALLPALEQLETVLAFKFTGNGPSEESSAIDGWKHVLWVRGRVYPSERSDYTFDFETKSNVGTPLANWIDATLKAIQPCQRSEKPSVP